ncbi:MAG: M48 family metalloprotease [Pseudomonadota bacterium]
MDVVRLVVAACLYCAAGAQAQVPDSGRWQELRFDADLVASDTEDRFIEKVVTLAAAGQLDEDHALLDRLHRIGASLVRAAIPLKPDVREWHWEFHTTSDPGIDALCMAGGKILIGSTFVRRLDLDDGELATLLAHEVAHAVAEHHRELLSEALFLTGRALPLDVVAERLDSDLGMQLRLARLAAMQESEADQLGMMLADRAGWPAGAMVAFYRKLAAQEQDGALFGTHPAAASRLSMARGMARLFSAK